MEHLRLLALRPRVASPRIKGLLVEQVTESVNIPKDSPSHIQNSRGRAALERWASPHRASGAAQAAWRAAQLLFPKAKDDGGRHGYWGSGGEKKRLVMESVVGFEFGDSILVWHIDTDAYLRWYRRRQRETAQAGRRRRITKGLPGQGRPGALKLHVFPPRRTPLHAAPSC